MPRVSVITPAHNVEHYIGKAIGSVMAQSEGDLELIVVDDASNDGTWRMLEAYAAADRRLKLIRLERNRGPGYARNVAMNAAVGDWITFLDADDWYEPRRLETLLTIAEKYNAKVVADNQFLVLDGAGEPWRTLIRQNSDNRIGAITLADVLRENRFGRMCNVGLLKPTIRAEFLDAWSIRYEEDIRIGEDVFFLLSCVIYAKEILFVPAPLYNYRIRQRSLTSSATVSDLQVARTICERRRKMIDPVREETSDQLFAQYQHEIDDYIRYRSVVEAMRNHGVFVALWRACSDPVSIRPLLRMLLFKTTRWIAVRFWRQNPPHFLTYFHEIRL